MKGSTREHAPARDSAAKRAQVTGQSGHGLSLQPPLQGIDFVDQRGRDVVGFAGLSVVPPEHASEKQAERVADEVCSGANAATTSVSALSAPAADLAESDAGAVAGVVARSASASSETPAVPAVESGPAAGVGLAAELASGGEALAPDVRAFMEPRFGRDLGAVRLHRSGGAEQLAAAVQARAFTVGQHVFVPPANYAPHTLGGRRLIAHELAHVLQQAGLPRPVVQRDALGVPPPDWTRGSTDVAFTVPRSSSASGVLGEMRAYVRHLATSRSDPQLRAQLERTYFFVATSSLALYDPQGRRLDRFRFAASPLALQAGFYLDTGGANFSQAGVSGNRFDFFPFVTEVTEGQQTQLMLCLGDAEARRLTARLAQLRPVALLMGIPNATLGEGDGAEGEGEGGDAEQDAEWAPGQVRALQESLREMPASQAGGTPSSPDRVVHWRGRGGDFVNVWVERRHQTLPLRPGESTEQLVSRVVRASQALREGLDPERSIGVQGGPSQTGFVEGPRRPGEQRTASPQTETEAIPGADAVANAPAYPSEIVSYGPEVSVVGATNRFEMRLDFAPAGRDQLSQVAARLQRITYYWEVLDVTRIAAPEMQRTVQRTPTGGGEQATQGAAFRAGMARDVANIGEDTSADLRDLTVEAPPWLPLEARVAWLGVIGVSNVVRMGGSLVSNLASVVTTPTNEQPIAFDHPGVFIVRCTATPHVGEGAVVIRASSVATHSVRVETVNARARTENDAPLQDIAELEGRLSRLGPGDERTELQRELAAMQAAQRSDVSTHARDTMAALSEKLAVLGRLDADVAANRPAAQRAWDVRLLAAQLGLLNVTREAYRAQLNAQLAGVRALSARAAEFGDHFQGSTYRPHVTLASEVNGMVTRMVMMLGEARGSADGARHYELIDVTAESTKQVYSGRSSLRGLAGHQQAIQLALFDFRDNAEYGRGTIAVRLPPSLAEDLHGPVVVEPMMRSAPGTRARVMQRLTDLATAAEIAALFVTGPVGLALGAVGGLAGAVVAIDRMSRRSSGNRLHLDFETVMDISAVVGGALVPLGVAAGGLSAMGRAASVGSRLPRWVSRVERVGDAIHVYGQLQMASTVIVVPLGLAIELRRIDGMEGLSPGEKAALRAEAVLGAIRSGAMTMVSAAQMMEAGSMGRARGETDTALEHAPPREEAAPRQGEARGARAPGSAPPTVRQSPELEALLAPDLRGQVEVVINSELATGRAEVVYRGDRLRIEVADEPAHLQGRRVQQHMPEATHLLRYRGVVGTIRRLIDAILTKLRLTPGYGTRGFEARLEVTKLNRIIGELEQMLQHINERGAAGVRESATDIQAEIDGLTAQLREHEAAVDSYQPGTGAVAANPGLGAGTGLERLPLGREVTERALRNLPRELRVELIELSATLRTMADVAALETLVLRLAHGGEEAVGARLALERAAQRRRQDSALDLPALLLRRGQSGVEEFFAPQQPRGAAPNHWQVSFGNDALSRVVLEERVARGDTRGNFAVFEFTDAQGRRQLSPALRSEADDEPGVAPRDQRTIHSEEVGLTWLRDQGIARGRVTRVYTEYAPCQGISNCRSQLRTAVPHAMVLFTWSYDDTGWSLKHAFMDRFIGGRRP